MKHTAGPWKSNPYVHSMIHGFAVYSDKSCLNKICDDVKRESDARLISCAPEMLEVLEYVYEQGMTSDAWRHVEPHEHARIQAYLLSIILKAKGEG